MKMSRTKLAIILSSCLCVCAVCLVCVFNAISSDNSTDFNQPMSSFNEVITQQNNQAVDMPQTAQEVYTFAYDTTQHPAEQYLCNAFDVAVKQDPKPQSILNVGNVLFESVKSSVVNTFPPFSAVELKQDPGTILYYYLDSSNKTLHISSSSLSDAYTSFDSSQLPPWFGSYTLDELIAIQSVVIDNPIIPDSTKAWFGCITSADSTGTVHLSEIRSFTGLENIDMSKVTDASFMFTGVSLASIDWAPADISKITNAFAMFSLSAVNQNTVQYIIDNMSSVTNAAFLFNGVKSTTSIDLDNLGTDNIINASCMFQNNLNLQTVSNLEDKSFGSLGKVNASNVNISCMFAECPQLSAIDVDCLIGEGVNSASGLFYDDASITSLSVESWDVSGLTSVVKMFYGCTQLASIYCDTNTDWGNSTQAPNLSSSADLFTGCTAIQGGEGTTYDITNVDKVYARVDKATSATIPGYFTSNSTPPVTKHLVTFVVDPEYSGSFMSGGEEKTSVDVEDGTSISVSGASVTIGSDTYTATAADGYIFVSIDPIAVDAVEDDLTVTANFSEQPTPGHTITVTFSATNGAFYADPEPAEGDPVPSITIPKDSTIVQQTCDVENVGKVTFNKGAANEVSYYAVGVGEYVFDSFTLPSSPMSSSCTVTAAFVMGHPETVKIIFEGENGAFYDNASGTGAAVPDTTVPYGSKIKIVTSNTAGVGQIVINQGEADEETYYAVGNTNYIFDYFGGFSSVVLSTETITATFKTKPSDYKGLSFTAVGGDATFTSTVPNLQYSTDGETWTPYADTVLTTNASGITILSGTTVYLKASNTETAYASGIGTFTMSGTGNISAAGNTYTLLNDGVDSGTAIPETLPTGCFKGLFSGCDQLLTSGTLSCATASGSCYESMFSGCSILRATPKLPAITLGVDCYKNMFNACNTISVAPELPATTLAAGCYQLMFNCCASLTIPPQLRVGKLASNCYQSMFNECVSLKVNTTTGVPFLRYITRTAANDVRNTFAETGGVTKDDPNAEVLYYYGTPVDYTGLCFKAEEENASFTSNVNNLKYSFDGGTWIPYTEEITLREVGDVVYLKADNMTTAQSLKASKGIGKFFIEGAKISASGNTYSLLDDNDGSDITTSTSLDSNIFYGLFQNCVSLTEAADLPEAIMGTSCFAYMFDGCSSLTLAPELPAKTLAPTCYQYMFNNCDALIHAPYHLDASTLTYKCYYCMFKDCAKLKYTPQLQANAMNDFPNIPDAAKTSVTLAESCYESMFQDCISLKAAPQLWVADLKKASYKNMFNGCISLKVAEDKTTPFMRYETYTGLADYNDCVDGMFTGTTGTFTSNPVPNTAYYYEWAGLRFTLNEGSDPCTISWNSLSNMNISTDGVTFYKPNQQRITLSSGGPTVVYCKANNMEKYPTGGAVGQFTMSGGTVAAGGNVNSLIDFQDGYSVEELFPTCYNQLFPNCKNLTEAPDLPAVKLMKSCYLEMFLGNTILKSVPEFLGTDFGEACCKKMFQECSALESAPQIYGKQFGNESCFEMFWQCSSLKYIPDFKKATLGTSCFKEMFKQCTSLVAAPLLPSTQLAQTCYYEMFAGCKSLTTIPYRQLPAIDLYNSCYCQMYQGCSKLNTAPYLPATVLANDSYKDMFSSTGFSSANFSTSPGEGFKPFIYYELPKNNLGGNFCTNLNVSYGVQYYYKPVS